MNDKVIVSYGEGAATKEELDAVQNKMNVQRENFVNESSPDVKNRLEKIHQAASLLDEAKIPFLLLAFPDKAGDTMQYNRLSYAAERMSEADMQESSKNIIAALRYTSAIYTGYFPWNRVCFVAKDGTVFEYIDQSKVYKSDPGLVRESVDKPADATSV